MSPSLAVFTLVTAILPVLLLRRLIPGPILLVISTFKAMVPLVYYQWFFTPELWRGRGDLAYYQQGQELLAEGWNPLELLLTQEGLARMVVISDGHHILYPWMNLALQYTFGDYFYTTVFFNILLTYIAGLFLYRLARACGMKRSYAVGLFAFFVIHWDVVAWSSFTNLKDTTVLTLTVMLMDQLVRAKQHFKPSYLAAIAGVLFAFFWIRFYVPVLVAVAFVGSIFVASTGRRMQYLVVGSLVVTFAAVLIGIPRVIYYAGMLETNPVTILSGAFRMLVTPRPWALEERVFFLLVPAWMHLVFLIPLIAGGVLLWGTKQSGVRLVLLYLLIALLLYGSFPELQGPRHRIQLLFALAWLQFHSIWLVGSYAFGRTAEAASQLRDAARARAGRTGLAPAPE